MIHIAIIGASGYSGAELLRLLSMRDDVRISHVFAQSSAGKCVDELYPSLSNSVDLQFEQFHPDLVKGMDVVFIALPSGEAMNIVPQILPIVDKVNDLGGDFRLPSTQLYEQFYKHTHTAGHLLNEAVYGLPELNKESIANARFIANPGCYPTSAILGLLPALQNGIVSSKGIVINSLSGVSGAGRTSSVDFSYSELNNNIRAYKIGSHQHIPEIQTVLEKATGSTVSVAFVPHLVPMTRGIYTTIHADIIKNISEEDILSVYQNYYADAPFVRVRRQIPEIRNVVYTNYCDVAFSVDNRTNKLIIVSVIDNLVKGAAGQAIQNMNILFNLPETEGFILTKERYYVS